MSCLPFFRRKPSPPQSCTCHCASGSNSNASVYHDDDDAVLDIPPPAYSSLAASPATAPTPTVYFGRIAHSESLEKLEILDAAALGVDRHGKICFVDAEVVSGAAAKEKYAGKGFAEAKVVTLGKLQFLFPGLIDCHFHAPQWPNNAIGMEWPLREWVVHMTDPIEASYADADKATRVYSKLVPKLLENGTTTAAYNSTIHVPATKILADQALRFGQRALVGKLCINHRVTSGNGEPSVEEGLKNSMAIIDYCKEIDPEEKLVRGCIQPRVATSVTEDYLRGLGKLAQNDGKTPLPVQIHMAEALPDLAYFHKLYPDAPSYASVYSSFGLLHATSVVAHCIHLTPLDISLLASTRAGVAHNPTSNTCLTDGECMVRELLRAGVKVGLGTDCSAGYSPSIVEAMRQASNVSRHRVMHTGDDSLKLSLEEVVFLATRGGADVVGLGDTVGAFEVGREFDALLVDVGGEDNVNVDGWEGDGRAVVAKWVFLGDDRSIRRVFVRGRLVAGKDLKEGKALIEVEKA